MVSIQGAIIASYMVIHVAKKCNIPVISYEESREPHTQNAILDESLSVRFYEFLQIYHIIIFAIAVIFFILSFVNVCPSNEDFRFGFHLLVRLILAKR